ncbi:hypothetical protein MMC22_001867 [Lobaria immixta]|nr:hypothetical protein [Lobaria immixta]
MPRTGFSLMRTQWHNPLFKEAKVGSLAWPINHHQRPNKGYHRPMIPSGNILFRLFATAKPVEDSGRSLHRISQIAEEEFSALEDEVNKILEAPTIPSEESVKASLDNCEACARSITEAKKSSDLPLPVDKSPASTLLSLEECQEDYGPSISVDARLEPSIRDKIARRISKVAYSIVTDPKVFITSAMLGSYVRTQSLLRFPKTIPQVFVLYASKPMPRPSKTSIRYNASNPNKASFAIPLATANAGLSAAIEARDLPVCFDIINTSVCTTAFHRSKIIRRALLPFTAFALSPAAAYALASQMATYQNTMDESVARNIAFAGILAYVGFTSIIGMVAVTTANDQMDRITWSIGTPLRERWIREEERALIDRVAGAWGFQDKLKRGEEEGRDWEALREWVSLRGMVLDRVSLMEGME